MLGARAAAASDFSKLMPKFVIRRGHRDGTNFDPIIAKLEEIKQLTL